MILSSRGGGLEVFGLAGMVGAPDTGRGRLTGPAPPLLWAFGGIHKERTGAEVAHMRSTEAGSHEEGATSKGRGASLPARRETLIKEADLQVRAIMRMEAWKRIAYSLVAVGSLLAYWQAYRDGPAWALVVGVAVLVVSVLVSLILYLVVNRAKMNVRAIMRAAGVDIDTPRSKRDAQEGEGDAGGTGEVDGDTQPPAR